MVGRLTPLLLVALVAAACGDGAATTTTGRPAAVSTVPATATSAVPETAPTPPPDPTAPPRTVPAPTTTATTTTTLPPRAEGTVPPSSVGRPWGEVTGLTMFRGNPTRTWYGAGPVPESPGVVWRYPDSAMCGQSSVGGEARQWCGTGWTGQPVVWERPDGVTEVIFGAYDKQVHFVDAATGRDTRTPFATGDIIKGSVTLDPDGYPLLYTGSRDGRLHVVALDRAEPAELWSLDADSVDGVWNDDWDGNPVVLDDLLIEGGENGWFFVVRLNRGYDGGQVTIAPEMLLAVPGYTDELIGRVGRNVSIENSPALYGTRVYFANSGGRVVGLDLERVAEGDVPIVFDYWVGDDVDATIVVDAAGMLYVTVEMERFNDRSREVGQLLRLDPYTAGDPLLWSVAIPPRGGGEGGAWATPALHDGHLYAATHPGELLAVDIESGEVVWRDEIGWHAWSSPVVVDDTLLVATCAGTVRAYDVTDPAAPAPVWEAELGGGTCIESTPAVWKGRIYVGARDGFFYALGE